MYSRSGRNSNSTIVCIYGIYILRIRYTSAFPGSFKYQMNCVRFHPSSECSLVRRATIYLRKHDVLLPLLKRFERSRSRKILFVIGKRNREAGLVTNASDRTDTTRSDSISNPRNHESHKLIQEAECTFASMIKDPLISIFLLASSN